MFKVNKKVIVKKSVVLETNRSDYQYISLSENRFNELNELMNKNDVNVYIEINYYLSDIDKKNNKVYYTDTVKVKELQKMGLRSRNKKDSSKNIYRFRIIREEKKDIDLLEYINLIDKTLVEIKTHINPLYKEVV